MNRFDKSMEVMHDLLLIQNDRKIAYEKIVKWPNHEELIRKHIKKVIMQCRNCILELRRHIDMTGSDPADRADIRGEIYHEWPGITDLTLVNSIPETIALLERNEKEVALFYQKALQLEESLCEEFRTLLSDQLGLVHKSLEYLHERKENPIEPATLTEEEKPFVTFRSTLFIESSFNSRLLDVTGK